MDPFTTALAAAGITAAGSAIGGYLSGKNNGQETKNQRTQRKLVDELLLSLNGDGKYKDLFAADENAFQKSFVEPAKQRFNSQIAPQIQQQYIANGQQNGTGLEDTLTRAGVDLDTLLNQQYADFQNQGKNRQQNAISNILGLSAGGTQNGTSGQAASGAFSGYLASPAFTDSINNLSKSYSNRDTQTQNPNLPPPRKGFEQDWSSWGLGDKRWNS